MCKIIILKVLIFFIIRLVSNHYFVQNIDIYIKISIYAYKILSVLCLVLLLAVLSIIKINVIYMDSK
jgi:hypothetical protein